MTGRSGTSPEQPRCCAYDTRRPHTPHNSRRSSMRITNSLPAIAAATVAVALTVAGCTSSSG
ncbi:MAG: hypothetical protein ACXVXY_08085, partial [Mycobacteriaceae bacterium]